MFLVFFECMFSIPKLDVLFTVHQSYQTVRYPQYLQRSVLTACIHKALYLYWHLRSTVGHDKYSDWRKCPSRPQCHKIHIFDQVTHNFAGILLCRLFLGVPEVGLHHPQSMLLHLNFSCRHSRGFTPVHSTCCRDGTLVRYAGKQIYPPPHLSINSSSIICRSWLSDRPCSMEGC